MSAPCSSSRVATVVYPFLHAKCKGVRPSYSHRTHESKQAFKQAIKLSIKQSNGIVRLSACQSIATDASFDIRYLFEWGKTGKATSASVNKVPMSHNSNAYTLFTNIHITFSLHTN